MLITLTIMSLAEHIHVLKTFFPMAPVRWLQTDLYFLLVLVVVKLISNVIHYIGCYESGFLIPLLMMGHSASDLLN